MLFWSFQFLKSIFVTNLKNVYQRELPYFFFKIFYKSNFFLSYQKISFCFRARLYRFNAIFSQQKLLILCKFQIWKQTRQTRQTRQNCINIYHNKKLIPNILCKFISHWILLILIYWILKFEKKVLKKLIISQKFFYKNDVSHYIIRKVSIYSIILIRILIPLYRFLRIFMSRSIVSFFIQEKLDYITVKKH